MESQTLQIIPTGLESRFKRHTSEESLKKAFEKLQDAELSNEGFSFYTSVASVYSSKIEGENIELDSYVKHKRFGVQFQPDYTRKIDDLYIAYQFVNSVPPNSENIAKAHSILAKHIVAESWQGRFRNQHMYVTTTDGKIEYVAPSPFEVRTEKQKFYYLHHQEYYQHIRMMGLEYNSLDYGKALPFLLMLPASLATPPTE